MVAIDQFNRVKIVDRVKSLLKLSQGEYVAIDNLRRVLRAEPARGAAHGARRLAARLPDRHLVPEPTTFAPLASKILGRTIAPEDHGRAHRGLLQRKSHRRYLDQYTKIARTNGLKGYEYIKGSTSPWSPSRWRTAC